MNLKFFCKVIEKNEEALCYNVHLNALNMSEIPSDPITIRKVYHQNLPINTMIYVSDSTLEVTDSSKKLMINKYYILQEENNVILDANNQVTVLPTTVELSEEIKNMILDSSFVPADIFK
jgi:hypothetical protein